MEKVLNYRVCYYPVGVPAKRENEREKERKKKKWAKIEDMYLF